MGEQLAGVDEADKARNTRCDSSVMISAVRVASIITVRFGILTRRQGETY